MKYVTATETAKIAKRALTETFPGVAFSVRVRRGLSEVAVRWTDGPNDTQVSQVVSGLNGTWHDTQYETSGAIHGVLDGERVRFCTDGVDTCRDHGDAAVAWAIERLWRRRGDAYKAAGVQRPTVEDFQFNRLWTVIVPELHSCLHDSLQADIGRLLDKRTTFKAVRCGKTVARYQQPMPQAGEDAGAAAELQAA